MDSALALLRGINVGGNNLIPMAELRRHLTAEGFQNVRTYIQSGNVLFESEAEALAEQATRMEECIAARFHVQCGIAVFTGTRWKGIVADAPEGWGTRDGWRHNVLALLPGITPDAVMDEVGPLKPEIEALAPGDGVLYHSVSVEHYHRARTAKLPSMRAYRLMTIRNANTARKLAELL